MARTSVVRGLSSSLLRPTVAAVVVVEAMAVVVTVMGHHQDAVGGTDMDPLSGPGTV